ncbi:uncharacterized protein GIQ15_06327 [Arthroderma uncinatum]|uniref:uncharacterized protein n=1 Tax=Arthroderma uncinatum TaxID=74035 RepID=UPI00144A67FE|nr:uncharacterized protein GIQ15_06327 [Arthroderma uncinatum]KAF3480980.1 hypothetical protein GIQ15_06327 [Arthroderma uncinatum]
MAESAFAVESPFMDSMSPSPAPEIPRLTISPADTTLKFEDVAADVEMAKVDGPKPAEKKPVKKRKSWGQELPTPKTNLPPRKRAKTEDEKEQRRIERVLRNRAAAQISRERKRLEIEKLEGEKLKIEQQNEFLLRRLSQMEEENNRLNQQVAKLASEIQTSKSRPGSPSNNSASGSAVNAASTSPTLAPVLFKQENDLLSVDKMDSIPFTTSDHSNAAIITPTSTINTSANAQSFSPSVLALPSTGFEHSSASASDMTQHPAAVFLNLDLPLLHEHDHVHPPPLSDADLSRLFDADSASEPDLSFLEDGLSLDLLPGSDLGPFTFDSLVDLGPDEQQQLHHQQQQQHIDNEFDDSIGFPEQTPLPASSLQPSFGASLERCDEQGIAAGAE